MLALFFDGEFPTVNVLLDDFGPSLICIDSNASIVCNSLRASLSVFANICNDLIPFESLLSVDLEVLVTVDELSMSKLFRPLLIYSSKLDIFNSFDELAVVMEAFDELAPMFEPFAELVPASEPFAGRASVELTTAGELREEAPE